MITALFLTLALALQPPNPETLPVGLSVNDRPVASIVVTGQVDDTLEPVALERWLLPLQDTLSALSLTLARVEGTNDLQVRGPFIVAPFPPLESFDVVAGRQVISVGGLEELLGVSVVFIPADFALNITVPVVFQGFGVRAELQLEGLPRREPPAFTVSALRQFTEFGLLPRVGIGSETEVVGALLGGSYYLRLRQPLRAGIDAFRLSELQYVNFDDALDVVVGDQRSLWGESGFFGVSTLLRFNYLPAPPNSGGYAPASRLRAREFPRTIEGFTEPGTLVRLVPAGRMMPVLDEVLVGSSGFYRFEDVPFGNLRYDILLYPGGRLAQAPTRISPPLPFSVLLPEDATALTLSLGAPREGGAFFGRFGEPLGGATVRRGITPEFTVGFGAFYENGFHLRGELLYAPFEVPLTLLAALNTPDRDGDLTYNLRLDYLPVPPLRLALSATEGRQAFSVRYQVIPELRLRSEYSVQDGFEAGFDFRTDLPTNDVDTRLGGGATVSEAFGVRAYLDLNVRDLDTEFVLRLTEERLFGELSYEFDGLRGRNEVGISPVLTFRDFNGSSLTSFYRYNSGELRRGGDYVFEAGAAHVISQNSGFDIDVSASPLPGLRFGAFYDGNLSNRNSLGVSLEGRFLLQDRVSLSDVVPNDLRGRGGILFQAFLDRNGNGRRDSGEEPYLDNLDLLVLLNGAPFGLDRAAATTEGSITIPLPVGVYRIDLDPAGFPIDFSPSSTAFAVTVGPGAFTELRIPFTPSFTVLGTLRNATGDPLGAVRVEAVGPDDVRAVSVTNSAGVFVFEGLRPGRYTIFANGRPVSPNTLVIDETSEPFFEINVSVP
ncbi:MAG: carboxypeptidase-like regulatory domain-containing protein [Trueperaceae bacterium]|nr:carboxypeptidase-like regulatory domain-containing protein [Trueperaceae bacterium]